jgi:hypothetical protein
MSRVCMNIKSIKILSGVNWLTLTGNVSHNCKYACARPSTLYMFLFPPARCHWPTVKIQQTIDTYSFIHRVQFKFAILFILSRNGVTIDGVWVGNWSTVLQLMTTFYRSVSHTDCCSHSHWLVTTCNGRCAPLLLGLSPYRVVTISRQPHTLTTGCSHYSLQLLAPRLNWLPKAKLQHQVSILHWLPNWTNSQSESEFIYNWRFMANQFILVTSPIETQDQ